MTHQRRLQNAINVSISRTRLTFAGASTMILKRVAGVSAALLLISTSAFATAILPGQANTSGTVTVSSLGIFFFGAPGSTPNVFDLGAPNTGGYAGLTGGTIQNLPGGVNLAPNVTDFTTFNGPVPGPVMFDLATFFLGTGTLAGCNNSLNSVCTPTGSPFTLTQLANGVSLTLAGSGWAYTGTSGTKDNAADPTAVVFTSQNLIPGDILDILAESATVGGFTNSYSATYSSTAVPEPTTALLMGAGLFLCGLAKRKIRS